jgi:hypothetical protein
VGGIAHPATLFYARSSWSDTGITRRRFDRMANKGLATLAPLAVSPAGRQQL